MKTHIAAAALAATFAVAGPALAQMDAGTLNCVDYLAMDAQGKIEATNAVRIYVTDSMNATTVGAAALSAELDDEGLMSRMDLVCTNSDTAAMGVVEALASTAM